MSFEERLWREDVERDLQLLRVKRAVKDSGVVSYHALERRFAVHYREGVRLGVPTDDDLLRKCLAEGRGVWD